MPVVGGGEVVQCWLEAPAAGGIRLDGSWLSSSGAEISQRRSIASAVVNRDWSPAMASRSSAMTDGYGIPLDRVLAAASRHDSPLLAPRWTDSDGGACFPRAGRPVQELGRPAD